jgi:putative ABC transport system permease protein
MIRHLLKLAWHRKRTNALLFLEIAASFLVVFAVGAAALYFGSNYRRPLGYDWKDVWSIRVTDERMGTFSVAEDDARLSARLLDEIRGLPGVVAAAGVDSPPYVDWTNISNFKVDGKLVEFMSSGATVGADKVLGLRVIAGRWFTREDDAPAWAAVVLDRDLANTFFGTVQCIGRTVPGTGGEDGREKRVVGVIEEYRKDGELSRPGNFLFQYVSGEAKTDPSRTDALIVRVAPGAGVELEEAVVSRLRQAAPQWGFNVRPLDQLRSTRFWMVCSPIVVGAIIAAFLLLMVGLGLIGVLWQNVARRTRELGLRRAMGATRMGICRQVLAELLLIIAMAVSVGTLLVAQIPLFSLFDVIPATIVWGAIVLAVVTILGIGVVAGLYPSWTTTRIHPAEALHHD